MTMRKLDIQLKKSMKKEVSSARKQGQSRTLTNTRNNRSTIKEPSGVNNKDGNNWLLYSRK